MRTVIELISVASGCCTFLIANLDEFNDTRDTNHYNIIYFTVVYAAITLLGMRGD